jgi:uncharacterized protein (DUF58 family)
MAMNVNIPLPSMAASKDNSDYPLFTSPLSRWLFRIYALRLTSAGRWFALITGIFIMYGGISLNMQGYMPAGYFVVMWFVAAGAMLMYRPRVKLTVRMTQRVCAGETILADVEVEQLGRLRGADLVVTPHRLPMSIESVPEDGVAISDLAAGERTSVRIGLRCNARGAFALRGFRVETAFPFGILRGWRSFPLEHKLLVYPKFFPLAQLTLPTGRRYQPGGVALVSQVGESFEYLGNREYREGDNVRDIDWRATARSNKPIVREWVEEYMLRAAVILDTHVPADRNRTRMAQRRDAFERAVSIAAGVSDYMARQDYLVDIFAAGPNLYHLTAGRSLAYLDQILDILACVNENPVEPFEVIEPQIDELLARLSTVICVFLDWNQTRRDFAMRMRAGGVAVKAIICRDGECTIDPKDDAAFLGEIPQISKADFERGISEL